ncbi:hypothetical protein PQB35_gp42 [Ochrobactrum phage vB_OspP_OH]|uniref:Uncharacterized protein n=1 Tax=Ochrobactrum phage vB_OspP_OH TaxID=2712957 RepID=A0A6G6XYM9_9CAUD|nr:hypothetical protein PQB35_gp42 [Ochrobactrum phage vB_OspP_OH]QIG66098.1 hypothetical protein phiOH_p42 [Ochrobactrum phage vB_OspP_OH]
MVRKMPAVPAQQPPRLPTEPQGLLEWCRYFSEYVFREFGKRPASGTPQDSVLLVSPTGAVYSVKVTDAGALVTEKVAE